MANNQISILGSTGLVGKELLSQTLDRGFQVKTLVRDPIKLEDLADKVHIVEGHYFEPEKLKETIKGSRAVLSTVGPQSKASPGQATEDYLASLSTIFDEMKAGSIQRFICILGAAVLAPDDKPQIQRKIMRFIMGIIARHLRDTKQAELQVISHSNLKWTALRPGMITRTEGSFISSEDHLANFKVDVRQLAGFMLDSIESDKWIGRAPLVATK